MNRRFIEIAALLGAISVALGAFGAHGLKDLATDGDIEIFNTAVKYQFYHVFALIAIGLLYAYGKPRILRLAGIFFITGILLFSGSLYLITWFRISDMTGIQWIGPVTPLGGLFLIVGWIFMFLGISKPGKAEAG